MKSVLPESVSDPGLPAGGPSHSVSDPRLPMAEALLRISELAGSGLFPRVVVGDLLFDCRNPPGLIPKARRGAVV